MTQPEELPTFTISCTELKNLLKDPSRDFILLDVRNPEELVQDPMLDGAISIPLPDLRQRIDEIKPGKPVIVYCHSGARGMIALRTLHDNGITNVKNLTGGIMSWK